MASKNMKKLLSTVAQISDEDAIEALMNMASVVRAKEIALAEAGDVEPDVEDTEIKPSRGKMRKAADEDEDEAPADDEDGDDDNNEEEEEEVPTPKKNTKKPAAKVPAKKTTTKPAAKVPAKKVAEKKPVAATDIDYSEMNKAELREVAEKYGLDLTKKHTKTLIPNLADVFEQIDTLAAKGSETWEKRAAKAGVDVTQPRGRSNDEKKARVIIVHMINANQSPLK
jgi:hypothetical protein